MQQLARSSFTCCIATGAQRQAAAGQACTVEGLHAWCIAKGRAMLTVQAHVLPVTNMLTFYGIYYKKFAQKALRISLGLLLDETRSDGK